MRVRFVRRSVFVALILTLPLAGCAKAPPTLPPAGVLIWQANEAVVAIGTVQHTAIQLNKVQVCNPTCRPLLSDKNTGIVVDAVTVALHTIRQVPGGWKPTTLAALAQIDQHLDAYGQAKLKPYVSAARLAISLIGA